MAGERILFDMNDFDIDLDFSTLKPVPLMINLVFTIKFQKIDPLSLNSHQFSSRQNTIGCK